MTLKVALTGGEEVIQTNTVIVGSPAEQTEAPRLSIDDEGTRRWAFQADHGVLIAATLDELAQWIDLFCKVEAHAQEKEANQ